MSDDLFANQLRSSLLAGLPADMQIGASGFSVGFQLKEAKERETVISRCLENGLSIVELMPAANDGVLTAFYHILMERGEEQAKSWLRQQVETVQ